MLKGYCLQGGPLDGTACGSVKKQWIFPARYAIVDEAGNLPKMAEAFQKIFLRGKKVKFLKVLKILQRPHRVAAQN